MNLKEKFKIERPSQKTLEYLGQLVDEIEDLFQRGIDVTENYII